MRSDCRQQTVSPVEAAILDPIQNDLLAPERVTRMANELQTMYEEYINRASGKSDTAPKDLQELDVRIERLRERLPKVIPT